MTAKTKANLGWGIAGGLAAAGWMAERQRSKLAAAQQEAAQWQQAAARALAQARERQNIMAGLRDELAASRQAIATAEKERARMQGLVNGAPGAMAVLNLIGQMGRL